MEWHSLIDNEGEVIVSIGIHIPGPAANLPQGPIFNPHCPESHLEDVLQN